MCRPFLRFRKPEGELKGLEFTEEGVMFTGFPEADDGQAFIQLASLMNKAALKAKWVLPRPVSTENEKYIFRIWLIRLGMEGKDYAKTRTSLLTRLSGNAAFKDAAMETRWKAKRKAAGPEEGKTNAPGGEHVSEESAVAGRAPSMPDTPLPVEESETSADDEAPADVEAPAADEAPAAVDESHAEEDVSTGEETNE